MGKTEHSRFNYLILSLVKDTLALELHFLQ